MEFSVLVLYRAERNKEILQTELILLTKLREMQCQNGLLEETASIL